MAEKDSNDDPTKSFITLTAGEVVSHYKIVEKIGSGGMGEVYLAQDTALSRTVALKFLPTYMCQDKDFRARFAREAQATAKLDHPNIVTVHEVDEFQGRPFFSMAHVEGQSLKEYCDSKELSVEQTLNLAIQICEGLRAAHQGGIIHRDIKPSNILIDLQNRVRIVDFGLATISGSDQLTKTGSTLGTIGYMSPEQVKGTEVDRRSDLFSLGVVLYELITRQNPFRKDTEAATMRAVIEEEAEPLARYKSALPQDLQYIISKALEKDINTRYQNAEGLLSDLVRLKRSLTATTSTAINIPVTLSSKFGWKGVIGILAVLAVIAFIVERPWEQDSTTNHNERVMLAVLPFENLGSPDDDYFADGITDEITTSLACLSGLGVISRSSAMQYKETEKNLKDIGKELNVDCVLEGTIRWDKSGDSSRVRIYPQLIRISDDVHLWAHRYDAVLTNVFDVQSTIAREVAAALDIALLQSEREVLAGQSAAAPEAYDYYLRSKNYFSITYSHQEDLNIAERMYQKAIELAPEFSPAYSELAQLYTEMYWEGNDETNILLDSARALIDIALKLSPGSPESYQALGWYYYHGLRNFDSALIAFGKVLELQPNNVLAIASIAWVERRQGKWDKATEDMLRAVQLAPRESMFHLELANMYINTRRFQNAIASYTKAIDLEPGYPWGFIAKSWGVFNLYVDPAKAMDVIDEGLTYNPHSPPLKFMQANYFLCAGEYEQALSVLTGPEEIYLYNSRNGMDYYFFKGLTYSLMDQTDLAHIYCDSARVLGEIDVANDPTSAAYHSYLGLVYAFLDRKEEAIIEAKRGTELMPVTTDALYGIDKLHNLAIVYTQVGEPDLAIDVLEQITELPCKYSAKILGIVPELTPVHNHPRLQALIKKYDKPHISKK